MLLLLHVVLQGDVTSPCSPHMPNCEFAYVRVVSICGHPCALLAHPQWHFLDIVQARPADLRSCAPVSTHSYLQIDDLLVGARNPAKAHLARSEVVQRAGSSSGEDPGAIPGGKDTCCSRRMTDLGRTAET